jgi:hypothetical protein
MSIVGTRENCRAFSQRKPKVNPSLRVCLINPVYRNLNPDHAPPHFRFQGGVCPTEDPNLKRLTRFYLRSQAKNLVIPVEALAGLNFADMEKKAIEKAEALKKEAEAAALRANPPPPVVTTTTTTTTTVTTIGADGTKTVTTNDVTSEKPATDVASVPSEAPKDSAPATELATVDTPAEVKPVEPAPVPAPAPIVSPFPPAAEVTSEPEASEDDTIFMGLRVYTDKSGGAATIGGQLRHEMEAAFANLGVKAK